MEFGLESQKRTELDNGPRSSCPVKDLWSLEEPDTAKNLTMCPPLHILVHRPAGVCFANIMHREKLHLARGTVTFASFLTGPIFSGRSFQWEGRCVTAEQVNLPVMFRVILCTEKVLRLQELIESWTSS